MRNVTVHSTAIVEKGAFVGEKTHVWAFCNIKNGAVIGKKCTIGDHCYVEEGAVIGDYVTIKNGVNVWDGVHLEEGVFVGPLVVFTNDIHPRSPRLPLLEIQNRYAHKASWLIPTYIRRGAVLGAGSIILAGHEIGTFATIAAGAVLCRDAPAYSLMVGNPARQNGWVCICGQVLTMVKNAFFCKMCSRKFSKRKGELLWLP